jgi:hypothetical protein
VGEKRVWEGIANESIEGYAYLNVEDNWLMFGVQPGETFEGWWGKRVRVTAEVIEDDHLEMDKLERE